MGTITTIRHSTKVKPFTWSYSRLKNFETCALKHQQVDILKAAKEEEGEALLWGNQVHTAFHKRLGKGIAMPEGMEAYEHWSQRMLSGPGIILVEQKMAITKDFAPCGFFDDNVWFRAIGDVIKLNPPVALIADWKTGKILEDSVQLALAAACVFAKYPEVKRVRSEFIWLKEDATTRQDFTPEDMPPMWASLWPRIEAMRVAWESGVYPANPNRWCRWCPVTTCEHNG